MTEATPAPATDAEQDLIEQARNEAQERVAELHEEEGSVRSEGAQNSPSPDDIDPVPPVHDPDQG
ncbi:MAG: hypothetical protein EOO27_21140 [Comamonadaceae bacterium]|nr:MAG: hypothetical protein EOO27_21140 [Comamonadaceae bacterium]